ncbi:MAG: hypothetical protein AB7S59_20935, partial [Parvibaculaceae bacterium]
MGYLTDLLQHLAKRKAAISELPVPWDPERISVYDFLQRHLTKSIDAQPFKDVDLPDEEHLYAGEPVRWAPGARDGVFGHHMAPTEDDGAGELVNCLKRVSVTPTVQNVEALYAQMMGQYALAAADQLSHLLVNDRAINPGRLSELAERIVRESPDREPVKLAIVLLGMFSDATRKDLIFTFGHHDEFTVYALVALGRIVPDNEREAIWWALAKKVSGWGRIHIVERLADTTNPEIKAWLLREGYRNTIMNEYLAFACAKNGNLVAALRKGPIDDALLRGAGDILEALAYGSGPAEGMEDYGEGMEACRLYVKHVSEMPSVDIEHCVSLHSIKRFADDKDRDWTAATLKGWTVAAREDISVAIDRIIGRPDWYAKVEQGLSDEDDKHFEAAAIAANLFGIDPWPYRFERQRLGKSDNWYALMVTNDPVRVDHVLDLALTQFDLAALASGPALDMVRLPEFRRHGELDFILQGLSGFPGKGWAFINAGLQSPVVSNRWNALRALSAWGRPQWPDDCEFTLF